VPEGGDGHFAGCWRWRSRRRPTCLAERLALQRPEDGVLVSVLRRAPAEDLATVDDFASSVIESDA
jgi:hypothetical protein